MKRYHEGSWRFNHELNSIVHIKAGEYEHGQMLPLEAFDIVIPQESQHELIDFMDKHNMVKPKMDNQSRAEDLKIVHRLIDLMEQVNK